jgi:hypothetical protein
MLGTPAQATPIARAFAVAWSIVLVVLAVGATTNLLLFGDFVQPYCSAAPGEDGDICRPCGLRWEMFGVVGATQCPNSIVDELLTVFVVLPRLLFVLFGVAWILSAPLLVLNFVTLFREWRRGDQPALHTIQLILLTYILLWGVGAAAFFLLPMLT